MILKNRNIVYELEKIYPEIKFDKKYSEHYISIIKFCLLNKIKEKIKNVSSESIITVMEEFTFKIERETPDLNSIIKVDDSLIFEIKDILINSFNQNSIKIKKEKCISQEKQLLIVKLLLYKNFEDINHSIFTYKEMPKYVKFYDSKSRMKDTKEIRELIRLKNKIDINPEHLFSLLKDSVVVFDEKFVKKLQFVELNHFLINYNSAYSTVTINLDYGVNRDKEHISFITKEGTKGYFYSNQIDLSRLNQAKIKYFSAKELIENVKNRFLNTDFHSL